MKKLWTLLKDHFREDFSWPYYGSVLAFLAAGITLNNFLHIEAGIDRSPDRPIRIAYYLLLYGGAYFGGVMLMVGFKKQSFILTNKTFWLLALSGLLIFSFDSGFPFLGRIMSKINFDGYLFTWAYSTISNGISLFVMGIPFLIIYWLLPESRTNRFGLNLKGYDARPYFSILLIMLPLTVVASFIPEFVNYYPTYKPNPVAAHWQVPAWVPMSIYEFFYATDFFNVELFARGFLVIALAQVLGKHSIMPMVVVYCFMHFGKPVGEQISSIIGGYVLGVIAFYTRGIWGGVIIHVGIAWMMELAAFLQKANS